MSLWKRATFHQALLYAVNLKDNFSGCLEGRRLPGARSGRGSPGVHQDRAGTGSQSLSHCSSQGTAPALGIGHLHGAGPRPGWDVSPPVGLRIRPSEGMARQGHGDGDGDGPSLGWEGTPQVRYYFDIAET